MAEAGSIPSGSSDGSPSAQRVAVLRDEIRAEMRAGLESVRADLSREIADVRAAVQQDLAELRQQNRQQKEDLDALRKDIQEMISQLQLGCKLPAMGGAGEGGPPPAGGGGADIMGTPPVVGQ